MHRSLTTHRTVILRLKNSTAAALAQVGAKSNIDLEEVLEELVEREYSADNKTARERQLERQEDTADPKAAAEITRLSNLAKEVR
jgi:hypothetical protein